MFKVNNGNSKLGKSIMVINVPAGITCQSDAPCNKRGLCYAQKGSFLFPAVQNCYKNNLDSFMESPIQAELEILSQLPFMGHVRLHASGDFVNDRYLHMILRIVDKLPNVQFMAYTKKYDMINNYILGGGYIPRNLTIIFSLWDGYKCNNPYKLPTSQVRLRNGNIDPIIDGAECGGECEKCYSCWSMQKGDNIIFNQH